MQEATSGATGHLARFTFAPPRHFVLPAVLLLLSEEPSYGYELVKGLRAFRFGDVDRPAVYRALAQLEKDGLVAVVVGGVEGGPGAPGLRPHRRRRARAAHVDGRRQGRARRPRPRAASLPSTRHRRRAARRSRRDGWSCVRRGTPSRPTATSPTAVDAAAPSARAGRLPRRAPRHRPTACAGCSVSRGRRTARRCSSKRARRSGRSPSARIGIIGLDRVPPSATASSCRASTRARTSRSRSNAWRPGNRLYDAELLRRIDARRYPDRSRWTSTRCTPIGSGRPLRLDGIRSTSTA